MYKAAVATLKGVLASHTNSDVAGSVHLKELVEMLPDSRYPLHDAVVCRTLTFCGTIATGTDLGISEASSKEACKKAVDRLHVVGTQHPAEVVMQLQVCRRACRHGLVHRSNDVWTEHTPTKQAFVPHFVHFAPNCRKLMMMPSMLLLLVEKRASPKWCIF